MMLSGTTSDVHIDSAWLSQQGAGAYVLMQNDTRYVLDTDITTAGTAVVIGGQNVNLDLNGHTITYGAGPSPTVLNGGFETGSGRTVSGWDLTLAPNAVLAPNTHYLFGNQVLRLDNFSQTQTLLSDPIAIPEANHTYTASVIPGARGDWRTTLVVSVLDAVSGQVLGTSSSGYNVERGIMNPVTFFATTTNSVRLKIELTPAAGITTSVELDDAAVMRSFDYGVLTTQNSSGQIPGFANLSAAAQAAYRAAADVTIQGGQIVQGQSLGYGDTAIYAQWVGGDFTVDSVRTQIAGMDADSLDANFARGKVTIRNSQFGLGLDTVANRGTGYAAITASATGGDILIENNHIMGTGQLGIGVSKVPDHQVTIRGNDIRNTAIVANSYAIGVVALGRFEISNNTVITDNGRGIAVDGWSAMPTDSGDIFGNYVEVQEGFNRENLSGVQARALRMRNNVDAQGPQRNIRVHDNTLIAKTGPGLAESAYGVRVSYVNVNGAMDDAGIVFDHNLVKAISFDPSRRAKAFVLDGASAGINLVVSRNVFESNDVSLQVGDSDGADAQGRDIGNYDTQFLSNVLRKSSEGAAMNYASLGYGYWVRENHRITFLDTQFENGATDAVSWIGAGLKDASFGWNLSVRATSTSGAALSGAVVSVFDDTNTQVFAGTANAQGELLGIPIVTKVVSQSGSNPNVLTTTEHTAYRVEVSAAGYTTSSSPVTMNQSLDLTIALTPNITGVNNPPTGANKTVTTLEDTAYTFTAADFGFSDPADSPANSLLSVKVVALPGAGSLSLNGAAVTAGQFITLTNLAAGLFKFTPAANANGSNYASFAFQVQDDGGTANGGIDLDPTPNTITINVTSVNDAPVAVADSYATNEDTALTVAAAGVLSNDSDADGNPLTAVLVAGPSHGTLSLNANGSFSYTPAANYNGADSFTYRANDGMANSNTATVSITVQAVNDPPAGTNMTVTTLEDTAYTFTAADFGFGDTADSPANSLLSVKVMALPGAGSLSLNGALVSAGQYIAAADIVGGLLKFAPAANASGAPYASFTFQVRDSGGTANGGIDLDPTPNTITVNVTPVDDPTDGFAGAVGWWKFDETSGSVAADSSSHNHPATLQAGATFAAGHSGSALNLSLSSQRAVAADSADLDITSAITLGVWIAPSKKATQTILNKGRAGTVDGYELGLSTSGKVFVRFNQATSGDTYRVNSTSSYPTNGNTWMYVAATYDGATIRLYVNGALQGSKSAAFTIKTNNVALGIGADDTGSKSMRGRIDDVLVANRALSASEISGVYQGTLLPAGAVNSAPVVNAGADRTTSVGSALVLAGSASDDGLPQPASLVSQWSKLSGPGTVTFGNANAPATTATFGTEGTYVLRLTASDGALSSSDDVTVTVAPQGTPTGIAGRWKFDEGSGSVAGDASGSGNQGTLQGGATFGTGYVGSALALLASNQRVTVNDAASLDITGAITIGAWIAPSLKGTQTVVAKGRVGSVDGYELSLSSTGKVFVRFNQFTSGDTYRLDSTSSYATDGSTWMHVAATYDGSTIRMYVNGVLQSSKAATFTIKTNDTPLGIGAEDTGSRGMRGRVDDVLVANRALSSSEILSLYQGTFGG